MFLQIVFFIYLTILTFLFFFSHDDEPIVEGNAKFNIMIQLPNDMDLLEYVLNMPSLLDLFFLRTHHTIFSWVIGVVCKDAVEVLEEDNTSVEDFLRIEMLVDDLDDLVLRDAVDEAPQNVREKVVADSLLVNHAGTHLKLAFLAGHHVALDKSGHLWFC